MCILTFQKDTWWCFFVFFSNHCLVSLVCGKQKTKRIYKKFLVRSVIFISFYALISFFFFYALISK